MRVAQSDKKILEALQQNKHGLSIIQIKRITNIQYPNQIFLRLRNLIKNGVVEKFKTYPCIYSLKFKKRERVTFIKVECPKCNTVQQVYENQTTKVCENKDCLTKSGIRTRFIITDKRSIGLGKII